MSRDKQYFYEGYAGEFDRTLNYYDLARRIEVVFDELALPNELRGRRVLDLGCGTGWIAERAAREGAIVVAADLGTTLVSAARKRAGCQVVVADMAALPFLDASFDIVLNVEVIEHLVDQTSAIAHIARVLRPGGTLLLTTPNSLWHWTVAVANVMGLRPYEGFENWIAIDRLKALMTAHGLVVKRTMGFNLFWPLSHVLPSLPKGLVMAAYRIERRFGGRPRAAALNVGVRAEKPLAATTR